MATQNYIVSTGVCPIPYILQRNRLVEGDVQHFQKTGQVIPLSLPKSMNRAAVRKALLGPRSFHFFYRDAWFVHSPVRIKQDGERSCGKIRFGCTTFEGPAYYKLRRWALAK